MSSIKYYFHILRPYQWIKNFFVLLPVLFSGAFTQVDLLILSGFAFILFSLVSSSVYIFNDLADLKQDQKHPAKKLRPLAAGKVQIVPCTVLGLLLSMFGLLGAFILNIHFFMILLAYLLLNLIYTLLLKHAVIIDVFCLAAFFILRVFAGAVVIAVEVSHWIILCTGLLALFLGFNKRRHELKYLGKLKGEHRQVLNRYNAYFIDQMIAVLTSSTAILYTLYAVDSRTVANVGSYSMLYTIPFVYYGIFRYLYIVHLLGKGGDPSRIVFSDKKLLTNLVLWLVVVVAVMQGII